jgi:hypothetical protein
MTLEPEQPPTGAQLRDEGMAAVIAADHTPHRDVRKHLETVLDQLIRERRPFTADDVHARLTSDVPRYSPNLLSAIFNAYGRAGRMTHIGWASSDRPTRHRGALRVWIGGTLVTSENTHVSTSVRTDARVEMQTHRGANLVAIGGGGLRAHA